MAAKKRCQTQNRFLRIRSKKLISRRTRLSFELLEIRRLLAAGAIDPSFGTSGIVRIDLATNAEYAGRTVVQPDGKIVTAGSALNSAGGNYDFVVARFLADGGLDTNFGDGGKKFIDFGIGDDFAESLMLQPDGNILVVGEMSNGANNDVALARLTVTGQLDNSFSGDGKVATSFGSGHDNGRELALGPGGTIYVAGDTAQANSDMMILKYDSSGVLVNTFGSGGKVAIDYGSLEVANSIAVQGNGNVVVSGFRHNGANFDFAIARVSGTSGQPDSSFGTGGKFNFPVGTGADYSASMVMLSNESFVLAGFSTAGTKDNFAIAKVNASGMLDTSFGTSGTTTVSVAAGNDRAQSIALQPDGKLLVTGLTTTGSNLDTAVVRLTSAGALDSSFDGDGRQIIAVVPQDDLSYSVAMQGIYKAVLLGTSQNGPKLATTLVRVVTVDNSAPTDIALSSNVIAENQPIGTTVGAFSSTDVNAGETFTYSFVSGTGSTDNTSFQIVGNQLRTTANFDFEQKSSYSIRVRTTDQGELSYEKSFTINVADVIDTAPVVTDTSFLTSGTLTAGATSLTVTFSQPVSFSLGSSERPAASAVEIKNANPSAASGVYWIDPNGGLTSDAFQVYCDMTTDGGGWMLAVNSVFGAEPTSNDITSNTGTVGLTTAQTRNLNSYFAGTATAEVRHDIDGSNVSQGRFHGKYTADTYQAPFSGVTTLTGHTNSALLQGSFNAPFGNNPGGAPWFYNGNPQTTIPASPSSGSPGPLYVQTGQILNSYRIWIRGGVSVSGPAIGGAELASNYEMRGAGADGLLGNSDDPIIAINGSSVSGNTATLSFAALPEDVYRLTVRDTITNVIGMQLDGDVNGSAGGNWRKDFVVGALMTSLTSPNGFAFDPEFGGFGTGQTIQGTNNAFDGLNRLQTGAAYFAPSVQASPSVDVYEKQGAADNIDFGVLNSLTQTFTSDGSPVRLQTSLTARAIVGSGGSTYQLRFVIDGIAQSAYATAYFAPSSLDQHIPINFEDWVVGLAPGAHTVQVRVDPASGFNSSADLYFGFQDSAFIRITEFNTIPGVGPSVDVYEKQGAADNIDFGVLNSLTQTFTSDGSPVRLQTSLTARAIVGSGGSTYQLRFVIDGIAQSAYATAYFAPSSLDQHIPINFEDWVVGLAPGAHTVQVRVDPASGFNSSADLYFGFQDSAFIRITEFNTIPGVGPSVDVYEKQGAADNIDFGVLNSLTQTFTSDGSPVRLQTSLTARAIVGSGGSTYQLRFVIDGIAQSAYATAYFAPSSLDQHIPINFEDWVVGLAPGAHTVQVRVDPASGFNSSADLYFGFQDSAFIRITEFNTITSAVFLNSSRTIVSATQVLSNLSVSREITVTSTGTQDFARSINVFTNPTNAAITTPVRIVGNLGSDEATTVFATSDGDLIVEPTDLWFGTDDADGTGTPAIIHLLHGPFGFQPTSVNVIEDNVEWTYNLTVAAGETKRLANFTVLGTTRAEAIATANTLVTTNGFGGEAAAFLTTQELASLVNFQFNTVPTDLSLSASSIAENLPALSTVGTFATTDTNLGDTFNYTLFSGTGDTDNAQFTIDGDTLKSIVPFDFETKSSYSVRVRSTDSGGLFTEQTFIVQVTDVAEANPTVAITSGNRTYNNSVYVATASITGNNTPAPALSFVYYSDAAGLVTIDPPENVGTYYVRAFAAANAGNNASQSAITQFQITPFALTGSITAANKNFDGNTSATILTRTLSTVFPGDTVSYVNGTATFDTAAVGTGKMVTATGLSLTGPDAGNYTVNSTATTTASITAAGSVVNRRVFYNGGVGGATAFGASTNFSTTGGNPPVTAIDTKDALLPGQNSSIANYTNVTFGINGIIVDIANPSGTLTAADFLFAKGETSTQAGFVAFTPTELSTTILPVVTQYVGGGINGSTRAKITFNNNSLRNTWVKVTVLANANIGLAANDVFYFGNAVGDVNGSVTSGRYVINPTDTGLVRSNQLAFNAPVTNIYDFNKSGTVTPTDTGIVRSNQSGFGILRVITGAAARGVSSLQAPAILAKSSTVSNSETVPVFGSLGNTTTLQTVVAFPAAGSTDAAVKELFAQSPASVPTEASQAVGSIDEFFARLGIAI